MGKKVKVTTKCGETFYYDHNQEVETVEIVEKVGAKETTLRKISKALADFVEKHHSWNVNLHLLEEHDFENLWGTQSYALVITLNDEAKSIFKEI